jgi:hypothetical protein
MWCIHSTGNWHRNKKFNISACFLNIRVLDFDCC